MLVWVGRMESYSRAFELAKFNVARAAISYEFNTPAPFNIGLRMYPDCLSYRCRLEGATGENHLLDYTILRCSRRL